MCLYLSDKEEFREKFQFCRRSLISSGLCASFKVTVLSWSEKIPFEYWNNRILLISLKTRFSSWFFPVAKSSLTNTYCFNIHALHLSEEKKFREKCKFVRKSVISCVLFVSVKAWSLLWAEKISSEYWNNRILLTSLKTQFFSRFFQVTKRLINQFLLFKYSCVYILVKKWNSGKSFNFIEGAWLVVACV